MSQYPKVYESGAAETLSLSMRGECAVVTGAASGLGREICLQLGAAGASVAALDVDEGGARAVAAAIAEKGGKALALGCDMGDSKQILAAVERAVAELGSPSLLFNVAAIVKYQHLEDVELDTFNRILAVNLVGPFVISKALMPHLVKTRGSILNVSSMAGTLGIPYLAAYCAAKGGMIAMTKSMAKEFANRGVRVNVITPGGIDTPMLHAPFPEDTPEEIYRFIPLSPIGVVSPKDLAKVAIFIASRHSANLSGALIPVDGAST